jgi:elongation factor P
MATTADLKKGLCIEFNGDLYFVSEFQHVKPGKGPAFVRTKLKNVKTGRVIDNTFSSGHSINITRVERRPHTFLYQDDMGYNFMDTETFEQVSVPEHLIEEPKFLKDGLQVELVVHTDTNNILNVDLPPFVIMQITYTEPGIKGDTATNTLKPATTETGLEVRVPLFINQDDVVKIDTRDKSYVERMNK